MVVEGVMFFFKTRGKLNMQSRDLNHRLGRFGLHLIRVGIYFDPMTHCNYIRVIMCLHSIKVRKLTWVVLFSHYDSRQ